MNISVKEAIQILKKKGFRAKKGSKPGTVKFLATYIHMEDGVTTRWEEVSAIKEVLEALDEE